MADEEETTDETQTTPDAATDEGAVDTSTETSGDTFDASEYEQTFGMPAGSLSGVKDADEALSKIRDFTDTSLLRGSASGTPAPSKPAIKTETKTETKGDSTYEALRKELDEVKSAMTKRDEAENARTMQDLNGRLNKEIDSWASAKYGVSGKRTYKQTQEYNEVCRLASVHGAGYVSSNSTMPTIESLVRSARAYHDDAYTLSKQPKPETTAVPVGTPGASNKKQQAPANIHEALQRSGR